LTRKDSSIIYLEGKHEGICALLFDAMIPALEELKRLFEISLAENQTAIKG